MKKKCVFLVGIALIVALLAVCVSAAADTWNPANTDGFGAGNDNYDVRAMSVFGSYLYAGTWSPGIGCHVWRSPDGTTWTQVVGQGLPASPTGPGFGDANNEGAFSMFVFGSYLYVGTLNFDSGCQVWRSHDGTTWTQVVGGAVAPDPGPGFGDANNQGAFSMSVFGPYLYAGTWNGGTGCQVWRSSDGTTWNQINTAGFGDGNNSAVSSLSVFGPYFYAGTWNGGTGCQVWRSLDGTTWNPTNTAGFGDVENNSIYAISVFGSYLYVGTTGCKVFRSADGATWHQVNEDGFGYGSNWDVYSLTTLGPCLYAGTFNPETGDPSTGCQVWKSYDGTTWKPVNIDGFGSEHNWSATSMSVFGSYLYVGTQNGYGGCQVWRTVGTSVVNASVSGGHGSVDPETQEVEPGSAASIRITPGAGYHTASVTDNGSPVTPTPATSYTISNVAENHEVVVAFASDLSTWYLAEGTNAWGFSTYITIENPNIDAVSAKLTYMDPNAPASGMGIPGTRTITLPPLSQTTVSSMSDIGAVDFSTRVECLEGKQIAVDRTMFWTGLGYSPAQSGYHSSIGVTAPSKTWYLPEGSSNWGFETWTLVENPNPTQAQVTLTYMTEAGPRPVSKTVPAYSRASYNMEADIGAADSSAEVTSNVPVVAERAMYRNNRREGSCSIGATAPATDFFLAEGATGYDLGFVTWVLVQNPNNTTNDVKLTYQTASGEVAGPTFTMQPNSRETIRVNDQLPSNTNVSTHVHGSKPLIAERAMYWDNDTGEAFHASIGLDSPHMTFMLPDGQTSSGFETWTLVQNPNPGAVTVRITYLPQGGGTPVSFTDEIPPSTRSTYNMVDKLPSGRFSILVQSLDGARPVMVERSMYMNNRGTGTDTIGGFSDTTD